MAYFYVSKTLTETQRKYSQIHKEGLSIIFALQKFHIYLFARKFILVTDAKPLLSLFNPQKATPVLAANRLSRWALILSQYDYSIEYRISHIEYRKTFKHCKLIQTQTFSADYRQDLMIILTRKNVLKTSTLFALLKW